MPALKHVETEVLTITDEKKNLHLPLFLFLLHAAMIMKMPQIIRIRMKYIRHQKQFRTV